MKTIIYTLILSLFLFGQTDENGNELTEKQKEALEESLKSLKSLENLKSLKSLESLQHLESLRALESLKGLKSLEKLKKMDEEGLKELEIQMKRLQKDLRNFEFQFEEKQLKELQEVLPRLHEELEDLELDEMEFDFDKERMLENLKELDNDIDSYEEQNKEIFEAMDEQHPNFKDGTVVVKLTNGSSYQVHRKGASYRIKKLKS